jgi:hypothetical protein
MSQDLEALRDAVCDEESFVRFLETLAADRADEVEKEKKKPSSGYGLGVNGTKFSWMNLGWLGKLLKEEKVGLG